INNLRPYAYLNNTFQPIPYQVDEYSDKGDFVYTEGKEANPGDGNGLLNDVDELVLWSGDLGDQVSLEGRLSGYDIVQEIEVTDPLTENKGWCYLFHFPSNPPPGSTRDYTDYYPETDSYSGLPPYSGLQKLAFWNNQGRPTTIYNHYSFWKETGGNEKNVIDHLVLRFGVRFLWGKIKLTFDERKLVGETLAYKYGTVREVRMQEFYMLLPLGLKSPTIKGPCFGYASYARCPIIFNIPINPKYIITNISLMLGHDLSPDGKGMAFYNSYNTQGFLCDGKMSNEEKAFNSAPDEWRFWTGPSGTLGLGLFWDPGLKRQVQDRTTVYLDDEDNHEYDLDSVPEGNRPVYPGQICGYYQTSVLGDLKTGKYVMYFVEYWPPNFDISQAEEYMNIHEKPLRFKIGDMEGKSLNSMPVSWKIVEEWEKTYKKSFR
ncbi:MAG: hypothetical protein JSU92_03185, partial [Deltaproteobacteria bacterium]